MVGVTIIGLEDGLVHWLENAGTMETRLRCRLEQLVEGPSDVKEVKKRLNRIGLLYSHDPLAAGLEFQLLAAAVQGDPEQHPNEAYEALLDWAKIYGFALPVNAIEHSHPDHKNQTRVVPDIIAQPKARWKPPETPLALLRHFQEVLPVGNATNKELVEYCEVALVGWADSHRLEVEEILTFVARSNRFGYLTDLLASLGNTLESAAKYELAARAMTLAYAGCRGGGGWLSFGDHEQEDLLVRAFKASRPVAVAVIAQEMMHRNGDWGVTKHVLSFFGRHDDVTIATAMWDEACECILVRLPGHESAIGHFIPFEPNLVPMWNHDDAAIFLILARISHPELRRKTAAICAASWLVQREPAKCIIAFRQILKASLCFTHQLWVLQLLGQFEPDPFVISQALAVELNVFVASGRFGTEQLALVLLERANVPVSGRPVKTTPMVTQMPSLIRMKAIMSLDVHNVVTKVAQLWPEFPNLVAGRFETIIHSNDWHMEKLKDRWEARRSDLRKSYPLAEFHGWEYELFSDSLHEVLIRLQAHMSSEGKWSSRIKWELLSLLLPSAQIPSRHYLSRRVRPSWPLPSVFFAHIQEVQFVPDGELAGWKRVAYFETYHETETSFDEIKLSTRAMACVLLGDSMQQDEVCRSVAQDNDWIHEARPLFPLEWLSGEVAGQSFFGRPFQFQELLGLVPNLANTLNLSGCRDIGPLDLLDEKGELAVAFRWWQSRPLGNDGFADELPRLSGGALLMRPDVLEQIVAVTKLHAFEAILRNVESTEDLIAKNSE